MSRYQRRPRREMRFLHVSAALGSVVIDCVKTTFVRRPGRTYRNPLKQRWGGVSARQRRKIIKAAKRAARS